VVGLVGCSGKQMCPGPKPVPFDGDKR
jgi:hypothetical protein